MTAAAVTIADVRAHASKGARYTSPRKVGYAAAELGADIQINPYPAGSRGYHSFLRGWFAYQDAQR